MFKYNYILQLKYILSTDFSKIEGTNTVLNALRANNVA